MKVFPRTYIAIVLLLLCLSGCSRPSIQVPDDTPPAAEDVQTVPSSQPTEPTASSTVPSMPPESQPEQPGLPELQKPEPVDSDFVRIRDYIPDLVVHLPYATDENFTGQVIYDFSEPWLRYGTVKKLIRVQALLKEQGFQMMIWDGFRPTAAQFRLWEICPDPVYVSNPYNGFSSHSRGNTLDLTLLDATGQPLPMPTGFDDFSTLADRDYTDCTPEAAENALLLEQIMTECGFKGYYGEWWHYSDTQTYPVDETFLPIAPAEYTPDCEEFISLRTAPSTSAEVITRIPVGEAFQVVALHGDFALAEYRGVLGYVLRGYIQPADS